MFSKPLSVLLFAALARAVTIHEIEVGEEGQRFKPEAVMNVANGDVLIFHLYPQHNVIQSDFSTPCKPSQGGFYSGPFSDTDNGKKKFVVNVTGDGPWYWYCGVPSHCQNGMVGGANLPTSGDTLDAYRNNAKSVGSSETPSSMSGGVLVDDQQLSSITGSASVSETTVTSTVSSSESGSSASESSAESTTTSTATTTASGSGGSASPTGSGSGSPAGSAASSTPTEAGADTLVIGGASTGALGLVLGMMGWLL